jgi:AraC family transcriptional regulator
VQDGQPGRQARQPHLTAAPSRIEPVRNDGRLEYEQRVNRVIDHIRAHLAESLSLAGLARVAAFSPFHFHRVFRAVTGETLFGFVQRQRIEKAAAALGLHPGDSVLAVALDHGFASAATFARAFRARFGMSATQWRAGGAARWRARRSPERKTGKQLRKPRKARRGWTPDTRRTSREEAAMAIRVRELPTFHVAYMRYVGPYGPRGIPELWERFRTWTAARGLQSPATITLGVAYDDPSITDPARCRYDACIVVPADFAADRRVNLMDVAGGSCAVAPFVGTAREIEREWDHVFRAWLPASGWEPDDRPCLELYRADPTVATRPGTFQCELCLPVRPL